MEDIFEKLREIHENGQTGLWNIPQESNLEEKLQYLILQQRYKNLDTFLVKQQKKYRIDDQDIEELKELLFCYNDLNEMNFIGTDMYANALFFKHKVPYLYRSVGRDTTNKNRVFGNEDIEYTKHIKTIFEKCLQQIETGGKGELFSYTKCFGRMLYKYATLKSSTECKVIEVRKDSIINFISENGKNFISIQKYMRECTMKNGESGLPYFAIDMSNARDNEVEYLKNWITEFLGKQDWHWNKDIVDPIGDAEVVCNFTNESECENCDNVQRMEFNKKEFCILLYKYFSEYANKIDKQDEFNEFVKTTLNTLENYQNGKLKRYYECIIINATDSDEKINNILELIDWENETKYMSRKKGKIQEQNDKQPSPMTVYKGDDAEIISNVWKNILFSAIEGKYLYIDYSAWK